MLDHLLAPFFAETHWFVLLLALVIGIAVLGKSADALVEQAVELSLLLGIPPLIVGATIVSLGTTLPEMIVSVMSAARGESDIALGNAVGSVICDTGLILGIGCLISPPKIEQKLFNQQSLIQFGAGALLVLACFPWHNPGQVFELGGSLPQPVGWLFLVLLSVYIYWSIQSARKGRVPGEMIEQIEEAASQSPLKRGFILFLCAILVVIASEVLILSAVESARRLAVPQAVIAATLVAFGTSLPELTVAITAAMKGRGDLVLGNIVGADILNVLFVAGAASSVTAGGLIADPVFFKLQFPAMLAVLVTARVAIAMGKKRGIMPRPAGFVLIGFYVVYIFICVL